MFLSRQRDSTELKLVLEVKLTVPHVMEIKQCLEADSKQT